MWQITLSELMNDAYEPIETRMPSGRYAYECPVCKSVVGLYGKEEGWLIKKDKDNNDHKMEWEIWET